MNSLKIAARYLQNSRNHLNLSPLAARVLSSGNVIDPPDNIDFDIPKPVRKDEPLQLRKARLLYQSRKRGMLENDLLLGTFVDKYLDEFNEKQTEEYDNLINGPTNDWDIYYWATEMKPTPQEYEHSVMQLLRQHCKNLNREQRLRQPDLKSL